MKPIFETQYANPRGVNPGMQLPVPVRKKTRTGSRIAGGVAISGGELAGFKFPRSVAYPASPYEGTSKQIGRPALDQLTQFHGMLKVFIEVSSRATSSGVEPNRFASVHFGEFASQVGKQSAEKHVSITVPIQSFYPDPLEIIQPLNVVVQQRDDDFTASFYDANINASGDTEEEAVSNLKDMIVATFELLSRDVSEDQLGPGPRKQLGVLRQFLR